MGLLFLINGAGFIAWYDVVVRGACASGCRCCYASCTRLPILQHRNLFSTHTATSLALPTPLLCRFRPLKVVPLWMTRRCVCLGLLAPHNPRPRSILNLGFACSHTVAHILARVCSDNAGGGSDLPLHQVVCWLWVQLWLDHGCFSTTMMLHVTGCPCTTCSRQSAWHGLYTHAPRYWALCGV